MCCQGLEFIWRCHKGQTRDFRHITGDKNIPTLFGVQAGTHRGAALGQFINICKAGFDPLDRHRNLMRIA